MLGSHLDASSSSRSRCLSIVSPADMGAIAPMQPSRTVIVKCRAFDSGVQLELGTRRYFAVDECDCFVEKGNLCDDHAVVLLGVRVLPSMIAGEGLFAVGKSFGRGSVICEYEGQFMTRAQFDASPSLYAADLGHGDVIDARRSCDGFARYANAAMRRQDVNAQIIVEAGLVPGGSNRKAFLETTRDIADGEEILLAYGPKYWRNHPAPGGGGGV